MIDFEPTEWSKILTAVMFKAGIKEMTITGEEIQAMRSTGKLTVLSVFEDNKVRVLIGDLEELTGVLEQLNSGNSKH